MDLVEDWALARRVEGFFEDAVRRLSEAEAFILGWAREVRNKVPLGLLVHVDQQAASGDAAEATPALPTRPK